MQGKKKKNQNIFDHISERLKAAGMSRNTKQFLISIKSKKETMQRFMIFTDLICYYRDILNPYVSLIRFSLNLFKFNLVQT